MCPGVHLVPRSSLHPCACRWSCTSSRRNWRTTSASSLRRTRWTHTASASGRGRCACMSSVVECTGQLGLVTSNQLPVAACPHPSRGLESGQCTTAAQELAHTRASSTCSASTPILAVPTYAHTHTLIPTHTCACARADTVLHTHTPATLAGEFVDANEELLRSLAPPLVAAQYYRSPDLYM